MILQNKMVPNFSLVPNDMHKKGQTLMC